MMIRNVFKSALCAQRTATRFRAASTATRKIVKEEVRKRGSAVAQAKQANKKVAKIGGVRPEGKTKRWYRRAGVSKCNFLFFFF